MEYLTNHDLFWVNQTVTGTVNTYDYFALEAAAAAQYAYGASSNVLVQAASLLERLLDRAPFQIGNRRTAFIATLTFLNANGYVTTVDDEEAVRQIDALTVGSTTAHGLVAGIAAPGRERLSAIPIRELITHECNHHLKALALLSSGDG